MKNRFFMQISLIAMLFVSFNVLQADILKSDDVIVPGHLCIGQDCSTAVDGGGNILMDFQDNTLILRENNLRIRLIDTSADNVLGQSWNIGVNDFINFGRSYFQFEMKSLTEDNVVISDGFSSMYDCSVPTANNFTLPPVIGTIPLGSPVLSPVNPVPDGGGMFLWSCETTVDFTVKSLFSIGEASESSVTLGQDSQPVANAVSIGNPGLLRNLKHVASGIANTNLLIKKMLDDYSSLADRKAQVELLSLQLAMLEDQVELIEDDVFPESGGSSGSFNLEFLIFLTLLGFLTKLLYRR